MKTPILTAKFETALIYATRLHATQTRKISGVPYISHLLSVAALVLEAGGNEQEAIAALLHDSIEDQGGSQTRTEIQEIFGDGVVEIIDACTESVNHKLLGTNVKIRVSALAYKEKNSIRLRAITLRQLAVLAETTIIS